MDSYMCASFTDVINADRTAQAIAGGRTCLKFVTGIYFKANRQHADTSRYKHHQHSSPVCGMFFPSTAYRMSQKVTPFGHLRQEVLRSVVFVGRLVLGSLMRLCWLVCS